MFNTLKEDNEWNSWRKNLVAIARSQDVREVLDSAYSLLTLEEEELFDEKQKFAYSIFDKVLKSDKGKSFVR